MTELRNTNLVLLGWGVASKNDEVGMREDISNYLKGISQSFRRTILFTFSYKSEDPEHSKYTSINWVDNVYINRDWDDTPDYFKPKELITDTYNMNKLIRSLENETVSYINYPGFYSFLHSPYIIMRSDYTFGYFGVEAVDRAAGSFPENTIGKGKLFAYRHFQQYVLNRIDLAIVRDKRMFDIEANCEMIESNPITELSSDALDQPFRMECSEPINILYVGKFRPGKGHKELIKAFSLLRDKHDCRLWLVGDGELQDEIKKVATKQEVRESVEFTGYISDKKRLADIYRNADIFVLPSKTEGFPRVINEAMAAGLPVVATDVGGLARELDNKETAILVDSPAPLDIVKAVEKLISNPALYRRISENSKKVSKSYFDKNPPHTNHINKIKDVIR